MLRKRHRRFLRAWEHLPHREALPRHRIRIEAKRLRYAIDALAALYPHDAVKAMVRPLGKVQHALGAANDVAVARRLIASLDPSPGLAQLVHTWVDGRSAAAVADFEKHGLKLAAAQPYWRIA